MQNKIKERENVYLTAARREWEKPSRHPSLTHFFHKAVNPKHSQTLTTPDGNSPPFRQACKSSAPRKRRATGCCAETWAMGMNWYSLTLLFALIVFQLLKYIILFVAVLWQYIKSRIQAKERKNQY